MLQSPIRVAEIPKVIRRTLASSIELSTSICWIASTIGSGAGTSAIKSV
jgi:hypothetical protein